MASRVLQNLPSKLRRPSVFFFAYTLAPFTHRFTERNTDLFFFFPFFCGRLYF